MNKKINPIIILLILTLILITPPILAQTTESSINLPKENQTNIIVFYGQGCPHCAALHGFLEEQKNDPNIIIEEHEIYFNDENRELFEKVSRAYNTEINKIPTTFIGQKFFIGFSKKIEQEILNEIGYCKQNLCENPLDKIKENGFKFKDITIFAVISAAIVDAINPCAFAVLIILITTILASSNRKKALYSGLAFSLSIFISYFLMGLGLYTALNASGLTHTFYMVVAILAIIIGIFNLKDYLWYGKWFVMEVPRKWRPRMKLFLKGVTSIPGAFLIGFIISLFLLPCTSGPYIVILGLLANITTKNQAIFLLLIYNLIFISPMILITLGIFFGITDTKKAEEWRTRKLKILHLIAGIIILLLGIGMIFSLFMGWI